MKIESPDLQDLDDFTALYVRHYEQLLRLAVLAGGCLTALALAAGGAPARLASLPPSPSGPAPARSAAYAAAPAPSAVPPGRFTPAAAAQAQPDALAEAKSKAASGAIPGFGGLAGSRARPSSSPTAMPKRP